MLRCLVHSNGDTELWLVPCCLRGKIPSSQMEIWLVHRVQEQSEFFLLLRKEPCRVALCRFNCVTCWFWVVREDQVFCFSAHVSKTWPWIWLDPISSAYLSTLSGCPQCQPFSMSRTTTFACMEKSGYEYLFDISWAKKGWQAFFSGSPILRDLHILCLVLRPISSPWSHN